MKAVSQSDSMRECVDAWMRECKGRRLERDMTRLAWASWSQARLLNFI